MTRTFPIQEHIDWLTNTVLLILFCAILLAYLILNDIDTHRKNVTSKKLKWDIAIIITVLIPMGSAYLAHSAPKNVSVANNRIVYERDIDNVLKTHYDQTVDKIECSNHQDEGRIPKHVYFIITTHDRENRTYTYDVAMTNNEPMTITLTQKTDGEKA